MLRINKLIFLLATTTLFCIIPGDVFADYEFYTYDGYEPIQRAFTALAHIFASSEIYALAGVACVVGCIAAGGLAIYQAPSNGGAGLIHAFIAPTVGLALFVSLFAPDDNLHIFDKEQGVFTTVADVPIGVAIVASSLNQIERGIIDLIETVYPGVEEASGAMTIMTSAELFKVTNVDAHLDQSIRSYVGDCVLFEITLPATTLSLETLRSTPDFMPELAKAQNPAIFTRYYDAANPGGITRTCTQSWTSIATTLNDNTTFANALAAACGRAKFDATDPTSLANCRGKIDSFFGGGGTGEVTGYGNAEQVIRHNLLASAIMHVARDVPAGAAIQTLAMKDATTGGFSSFIAANELLPIFKAGMMSIAIGLIPFVGIFIASNLAGRALSFIVGIFVYLAAWGVADAVVTASAAPFINDMFASMREGQFGLETMLAFPDTATKTAAIYGSLRSMGALFAGAISFMLVKFGSNFMAGAAGQIGGQMTSAGRAGGVLASPEGRAQVMTSMTNAVGTSNLAASNSFATLADQSYFDKQMGVARYQAGMQAGENNNIHGIKSVAAAIAGAGPQGRGVALTAGDSLVSQSVGPGGAPLFTQKTSMSGDWQRVATTGPNGQSGFTNSTSGVGQLSFDSAGQLTGASVNGIGNVSMSEQERSSLIKQGSDALSTSTNLTQGIRAAVNSSSDVSASTVMADKLENSLAENTSQSIKDGSLFKGVKSQDMQSKLTGALQAQLTGGTPGQSLFGFGASVRALGEGKYEFTGADGKSQEFSASAEDVRAFQENFSQVKSQTFSQMASTQDGRQFLADVARQDSASGATNYFESASYDQSSARTATTDEQARLVSFHAQTSPNNPVADRNSPESKEWAATDINRMNTFPSQQGRSEFQSLWSRFSSSQPASSVGGVVQDKIQTTENVVHENTGQIMQQTSPDLQTATTRTGQAGTNVDNNTAPKMPEPVANSIIPPLRAPDKAAFEADAQGHKKSMDAAPIVTDAVQAGYNQLIAKPLSLTTPLKPVLSDSQDPKVGDHKTYVGGYANGTAQARQAESAEQSSFNQSANYINGSGQTQPTETPKQTGGEDLMAAMNPSAEYGKGNGMPWGRQR
ncbi:MAG: conjugal transfer protein TraG N-terminal domain-containing protein [Desulfuromonadales bacterium]|nr:conjugal transfer protein TraG N-terminal domain-containing protein [Desulfuromonadales bacterium]MBN2793248.1 conjugal transfer protein TraG N-terminal domain-containing protein [Desulfuromonadales bacterium]